MSEISVSQYMAQGSTLRAGQAVAEGPLPPDTLQDHPLPVEPRVSGYKNASPLESTHATPNVAQGPMPVTSTSDHPVPSDGRNHAEPIQGEPDVVLCHEEEPATDSHALAVEHVKEGEPVGAAQIDHGSTEVRNLGWDEEPHDVPNPLVGGLPNEELWTLIRRFNKQMYHVKKLEDTPLGGLDLMIADEEEFSPDKLRANIERLYMTIIVSMVSFANHIARLRSWREENRTMTFMFVYFVAWAADYLVPLIIIFLMVLIVHPPAREYCFPPAPVSLIDSKTGGVKKPAAGVLGSDDSLTGAPEKHQGEAVEQEASNFVNGFTSIAISSATGKHPQGSPHDEDNSAVDSAPDPTNLASAASAANEKTGGGNPSAKHDKTKEPMSQAMWAKTRPIMHGIADVSDGWERFANALSPTSPFPRDRPRMILAAVLAPVLLLSLFTSSYMFMKANSFFIGFGFFGNPVIMRGLHYLNHNYPHWQKLLEIRNTLLKGVPTNAQLTITLLRIGEANKAPLPPPPRSGSPPPDVAMSGAGQDLDHLDNEGASEEEIANAVHPELTAETAPEAAPPKKKHGRRLLALMKGTVKGGVETMLGTDRLKAAAGVQHAKNRLGVLKNPAAEALDGPVEFPARFKGKKGHLYITTTATTPAVSWTNKRAGSEVDKADIEPVFSVAVQDIRELKKVGGFGWKTRLLVGWATEREVADGILIVSQGENGEMEERLLTAIALREELFNRLVSMGNQMWESW